MDDVATPLATIAIPTFNRAEMLKRAVASARAQDYPCVEILIVDNASEDATEELCLALVTEDPRIRYMRQPRNVGPVRNFEMGLENARGHYFMWLADDDWITPNYVRRCVQELETHHHILVVGRDYSHDGGIVRSEPIVAALEHDPVRRMLSYMRTLTSNAAFYGLAKTSSLRPQLPLPRQIGGDIEWVVRLLDSGTLAVVDDAGIHRSTTGISQDIRNVAVQLGSGRFARRFPRVSQALALCARFARTQNLQSSPTVRSRLKLAAAAGLICWIRAESTSELVGPTRLWLQRVVPGGLYGMLRGSYRPLRSAQNRIRNQVLYGRRHADDSAKSHPHC